MQKKYKRILFICPYPFDQAPSQRFRFEQYYKILEQANFKIDIAPFWSKKAYERLYKKGNLFIKFLFLILGYLRRTSLCSRLHQYDFIFIHREATPLGPPIVEWVAARIFKKKVIYDFDDAIWIPNTSDVNSFISKMKWHSKVASICKWSTVISCGNDFLCDFARQYNNQVVLNPTTIDTENLHKPTLRSANQKTTPVTIGWTGTHSTLNYLNPLIPAFQSLEEKFPKHFSFVVIADKAPAFTLKSLRFVPWRKETEIEDLHQFDIGIMPLTEDEWSKGKCGFKALQYLAMEIPAVVSPVGVNTIIIENGINGFIATTTEDWIAHLSRLILDTDLRNRMGPAGRKKILESYSITSNASNFLSLFE